MVFITKSYQDLFGVRSYINAFFKVKVFIEKQLEHFHKNGLHIKTLKDTRHVFHLKKEISNYFFIFPSFTSSDSALANDGRVTPSFCATSC